MASRRRPVDSQGRVYCFNRGAGPPDHGLRPRRQLPVVVGRGPLRLPTRHPRRRAGQPLDRRSGSRQALLYTLTGELLRGDRHPRPPLRHRPSSGRQRPRRRGGSDHGAEPSPADRHRADAVRRDVHLRRLRATPGSTSSPPMAPTCSPGESRAPEPTSSGCHTASGSTGAAGCWCRPAKNDRARSSTRKARCLEIWPTELIGPAFFYVDAGTSSNPGTQRRLVSVRPSTASGWRAGGDPSFRSVTASGATPTAISTWCAPAPGAGHVGS